MVKGYLSQKGIEYTVRNISQDLEARQTVIDMGHRSTPVTLIGEHKVWASTGPNWRQRWWQRA